MIIIKKGRFCGMTKTAQEIVKIFTGLSPESQNTFLMYARIAEASEAALKNAINRALKGGDDVANKDLGVKNYEV